MNRQELRQTLALANEFKEGDLLIGGTQDEQVRTDARRALGTVRLSDLAKNAVVEDGLTQTLARSVHKLLMQEIGSLTVSAVKRMLTGSNGAMWWQSYRDGLTSEAIAALVKTMTNDELAAVARTIFPAFPGTGVNVGSAQHFGSCIQANSPTDDEEEVLFSVLEGLSYGCGDVLLTVTPARADEDTVTRLAALLGGIISRLKLPTRFSVLANLTQQAAAAKQTKMEVVYQPLCGTAKAWQAANGIAVEDLPDAIGGVGGLFFDFEQGRELLGGAAEEADMVTLAARGLGVARYLSKQVEQRYGRRPWLLAKGIAGWSGPALWRSGEQLVRACLENVVLAKLHGIPVGLDAGASFQLGIEPQVLQQLTPQIAAQASPAFLLAVAGSVDPARGYLTTSFREHPRLRKATGKTITSAMQQRLGELGIVNADGEVAAHALATAQLYAAYEQAGGDTRSQETLQADALKKLNDLNRRGFDLGYGHGGNFQPPKSVEARLDAIFAQARRALYARLDEVSLKEAAPHHLRVRTQARDREAFLAQPITGALLQEEDAARVQALLSAGRPQVQLVFSDGWNANALNENLRGLLPALRDELARQGCELSDVEVLIENGGVEAGYHVGALLEAEVVLHLLGERPGTGASAGLDALAAYLTYGYDERGDSRWGQALNSSHTTIISGIHRQGLRTETAAAEIARCVALMIEMRNSGSAFEEKLGQESAPLV